MQSPARAFLFAVTALTLSACGGEETVETRSDDETRARIQERTPRGQVTGRFREMVPEALAEQSAPDDQRREMFQSLGYSSGSREVQAPRVITVHDSDRAYAGYNLVVSAHKCSAELMDMEGNVLHAWSRAFDDIFEDYPVVNAVVREKLNRRDSEKNVWRRAYLLEGGDLLVIFEFLGLVKLDKDSNVIWAHPLPVHHDLQVLPTGEIAILGWRYGVVEHVDPKNPILEDFVLVLSPQGEPVRVVPIREYLERSDPDCSWETAYKEFAARDRERKLMFWLRDVFHTNSIEVLDGRHADRHPALAAGNILLSMRHLDMILILDPRREEAVWWVKGLTTTQHDAKVTPDGKILAFNNWVRPGVSSVVMIDPHSREVVWSYEGTESRPLYSKTCGTTYVLPNRNILIVESDGGRCLEITPRGEVVWEFYNPHRAGEGNRFIATLFDVMRLPADLERFW